jgi:CRISPR/Cas system CSM-associated protein Csm3 (group 7 of RAMP superfamily)
MHKTCYGECRITLVIEANSMLLIQGEKRQQGHHQVTTFFDPTRPSTQCKTPCLPASSLKGIWRTGVERILRSFDPVLACDPFSQTSCSQRLQRQTGPAVYSRQCPACQVFGSTAHAGLIHIENVWQESGNKENKTAIAVDRITGGVRRSSPYTVQPLGPRSRFTIIVTFGNFDLWHIGMLALVWREMDEGALPIGSGGRKGLGIVSVTPSRIAIRYPRRFYASSHADSGLYSARYLAGESIPKPDETRVLSGLCPVTPAQPHWRDTGWISFALHDQEIAEFFKGCVEESLAPRLQQGCNGFDYQPEEIEYATKVQKPL